MDPNPGDVGTAQFNALTWGAEAQALGYDLYTYDGNLAMAKWLFGHHGPAPWKYAKSNLGSICRLRVALQF